MDENKIITISNENILLSVNSISNYKEGKGITLVKSEELDMLTVKILKKELSKKEYTNLITRNKILFSNFSQEELITLIGISLTVIYLRNNNKKIEHNKQFLKNELEKYISYQKEFNFNEYNKSKDLLENIPYTHIKFPLEKDAKRFVLYFRLNNKDEIQYLMNFLRSLSFSENNIEILKNIELIDKIGVGFKYVNSQLVRKTLYTSFLNEEGKENQEYIENLKSITIKDINNISFFGVDEYEKSEEIKIYSKTKFKLKMIDKNILKVLKDKNCIICEKYKKNELISIKYEFQVKSFSENEVKILEKYDILKQKINIISFYFDDNKNIQKTIFY